MSNLTPSLDPETMTGEVSNDSVCRADKVTPMEVSPSLESNQDFPPSNSVFRSSWLAGKLSPL